MKIKHHFGQEKASAIESKLEMFCGEFQSKYKYNPGNRVLRCIIQLAQGNEDELDRMIGVALIDTRDVMWWAEYDREGRQIFSGYRKFT